MRENGVFRIISNWLYVYLLYLFYLSFNLSTRTLCITNGGGGGRMIYAARLDYLCIAYFARFRNVPANVDWARLSSAIRETYGISTVYLLRWGGYC